MSPAGLWTVGLAVSYTALLILGGRLAQRRSALGKTSGFFVGGRTFSPWTVAFCITGLFSGSSYIAIMELSYRTGISALWYGVAETVQILLIALLLVKPLREKLVVTVTGIIGDRFGRLAKGISGVITAFTFPMWSVATTIAFASALTAFTGLNLHLAVIVTALLLLVFLWSGGMRSVAFNQTLNCIVFVGMLIVGAYAVLAKPGIAGLRDFAETNPQMFDPGNAGISLIVAWFGTFIVNVPLAQAAFQMTLSCRTPEDGQKGLYTAAAFGVPFIVIGALIGTSAAIVMPGERLGLVAIPHYIEQVLPAPLVGVFFLGVWACAMGWAGPCQFSGATSLGRDVGSAINPKATEAQLVRYTQWSLVALTGLMIIFSILRTEQSAWWNVLAWTLRNGATLAPVLAVFFWPLATRASVYASMVTGFSTGIIWNQLAGWSPTQFFLGTHPVWVGMMANVFMLVAVTLLTTRWRITHARGKRRTAARFAGAAVLALVALGLTAAWLAAHGLVAMALFIILFLTSLAIFYGTEDSTPCADADIEIDATAPAQEPASVA
ncbi:sodium:solute symporter family protein [Arthrobacter sp. AQ5-05]|uniref:sodium:solute symporter family protein n=1 Tax=Arthrobacter sp. AQ5-05 TaxID=2184581 RepID=UPI000DCDEA0C|nr:sodium:solute symporter family protein [Arthrobacter sp. AQ5-05]RAX46590.1 sodium:solute symporter family protein [Arthrobacter sp. AQ5-05]